MMKNKENVMRYFEIGEETHTKIEYCDFGIIETPIKKTPVENATVVRTNTRTQNVPSINLNDMINAMAKQGITIVK